jgi:hypothetical protein
MHETLAARLLPHVVLAAIEKSRGFVPLRTAFNAIETG